MSKNIGEYVNEISVEADTIGNILNERQINHVDHYHITINGAELEAIEGIDKSFLKKGTRFLVYCETLIKDTNETVTNKVIEQLKENGLKVLAHVSMPKHPNIVYGII